MAWGSTHRIAVLDHDASIAFYDVNVRLAPIQQVFNAEHGIPVDLLHDTLRQQPPQLRRHSASAHRGEADAHDQAVGINHIAP